MKVGGIPAVSGGRWKDVVVAREDGHIVHFWHATFGHHGRNAAQNRENGGKSR